MPFATVQMTTGADMNLINAVVDLWCSPQNLCRYTTIVTKHDNNMNANKHGKELMSSQEDACKTIQHGCTYATLSDKMSACIASLLMS